MADPQQSAVSTGVTSQEAQQIQAQQPTPNPQSTQGTSDAPPPVSQAVDNPQFTAPTQDAPPPVSAAIDNPDFSGAPKPGFLSRTGETSGVTGASSLIGKELFHPVDLYNGAVAKLQSGDWRGAVEDSFKLYHMFPDKEDPLAQAAMQIIMHPITEIQGMYEDNRKAGNSELASMTNVPNIVRGVKDALTNISADIAAGKAKGEGLTSGDTANKVVSDIVTPAMKSHLAGMVPVVGGAIQQLGKNLNEDEHADNTPALAGDVVGTAASVLAPKAIGAAGEGLEAAGNTSKGAEAAETVSNLSKQASNAVPAQNIFNDVGKAISDQKAQIDSNFTNQTQAAETGKGNALETNQKVLDESKNSINQTVVHNLETLSQGAPMSEELATSVNNAINAYEEAAHQNYETGINDISDKLKGKTLPVKGSNAAKAAQEKLAKPVPDDHELTKDLKGIAGDKLDGGVKTILEKAAKGGVEEKATSGGAGFNTAPKTTVTTLKPLPDTTIDDLISIRQAARKAASGYVRGDVNQQALNALVKGIDKDIDTMAENSGNPEVASQYSNLKAQYRAQRELLDSRTSEKLNLTDPDQALDDVNKYLLGGGNPSGKIGVIRGIMGKEAFNELVKAKVAQFKTLAESDPVKFSREWEKTLPSVRDNFYGPELSHQLDAINKYYKDTTEYVNEASGNATSATTGTFTNSIKAIKDAYQSDSAPYSGSFMKDLAEGRISENVLKGNVDLQDIQKIKGIIGDDKWQPVAKKIFDRAIADSSPEGRFNPQSLVKWWENIKPEVRDEMFSPEAGDTIGKAEQAAKVQGTIKKAAGTAAVGGLLGAGGAVGSGLAGPTGELIGAMTGLGTGAKFIKDFAEWASTHPKVWQAVGKASEAASSAQKTLGKGAQVVGKAGANGVTAAGVNTSQRRPNWQSGASSALGGNQ